MKRQFLLYLFILSLLMNVFTYMYFSRKEASTQNKYTTLSKKFNDSIQTINNRVGEADYFSLEYNNRAQNYLAASDLDYSALAPKIKEDLLEFNSDPEGNKYVDQSKIGDQKFIINKIKILNHRWIIADYSNGSLWGEVLLMYLVQPDATIKFETISTYLYSQDLN
ncbi:MAG: hypothetical protein J0L86_11385 [Flavobacteriales bacterium]|nr:hypothetical protein [Flavobacteriales bacterium]